MSGLKLKQLFSNKLPRHEQDTTRRPSAGFVKIGQPAFKTTAEAYIAKYANAEERAELSALVSKIEARRAKLPKFYYSICEKCGRRTKFPFGDRDVIDPGVDYCLRCNSQRFTDGSKMREMTKAEAVQYDVDVAAWEKRASEKLMKSNLFGINQKRQEEGLSPLTLAEYQAREKRLWREQCEMDSRVPKKYWNSDAIEAEKAEEAGAVVK